jgi:O-antigen/teichoic acid export membrane protein
MKDNFLYTLSIFYSMVVTFIFSILIRRIVLPEIIGAFAFVNSITVILNLPGSVLRGAVDRLVPKYLGLNNEQFTYDIASMSLSTLITISIFESILLFLIGLFFKNDPWQYYAFIVVAIVFLFSSISTFFKVYLKSLNKIKNTAYLLLISPTLEPIFYLIVLLYKNKGYYIGSLLIGVCASILMIYYSVNKIPWSEITPLSYKFKNFFSNSLYKEIIGTGSLLLFYEFLFQFLFIIDRYFVKFLEGNTMLAFYDFAVSGTTKVLMLFVAFIESFSPRIYRNFAVNKNQNYLIDKLTYSVLMISYTASFVIFTLF